jgi:hypothetical protein
MRVDYDKDQLAYALANALKERDEAREKYDNLAAEHMLAVNKLAEERDEAQKELSSIHRWIERNHPDGFIDSLTYFQNLERVTDNWYDRLDRLEIDANRFERERDEARHKLELCMAANSDVARIAKERDEAREQNAKLREIADALGGALERLDALYRSEQDSEAPMPRPDWLRRPLQMLDAELDRLKEGAK